MGTAYFNTPIYTPNTDTPLMYNLLTVITIAPPTDGLGYTLGEVYNGIEIDSTTLLVSPRVPQRITINVVDTKCMDTCTTEYGKCVEKCNGDNECITNCELVFKQCKSGCFNTNVTTDITLDGTNSFSTEVIRNFINNEGLDSYKTQTKNSWDSIVSRITKK